MTEDLFTRLKQGSRIKKRPPLSEQVKKAIRLLMLTLGMMIAVLASAFLYFSSMMSQKGHLLTVTQSQNQTLKEESDNLEQKLVEAASQESLKENPKLKKMNEPERKVFIPEK